MGGRGGQKSWSHQSRVLKTVLDEEDTHRKGLATWHQVSEPEEHEGARRGRAAWREEESPVWGSQSEQGEEHVRGRRENGNRPRKSKPRSGDGG